MLPERQTRIYVRYFLFVRRLQYGMPKPRATDAKLERLKALRDEKASPAVAAELQKFLRDASNHVVAVAAALAARLQLRELAPEMVAAFERFMIEPTETDKTCSAKTAIIDALNELTRLIAPPAWTNSVVLTRDTARITGEAPDAAPLLRILDGSPLFANSATDFISRNNTGAGGETFQIHSTREGMK